MSDEPRPRFLFEYVDTETGEVCTFTRHATGYAAAMNSFLRTQPLKHRFRSVTQVQDSDNERIQLSLFDND
jgi:hypothetical protein